MQGVGRAIGIRRGAGISHPTMTFDASGGALPSDFVSTRATKAWYFDSTGTYQEAANNVPRFEYNPKTLSLLGLLIEPQSTNRCPYSVGGGGTWVPTGTTLTTNNAVAPNGLTEATRISEDTSTGTHYSALPITIVQNNVHSVSCFVKPDQRTRFSLGLYAAGFTSGFNASFNLSTKVVTGTATTGTGTIGGATITEVANGWFRVTVSGTVDATTTTAYPVPQLLDGAGAASYTGVSGNGLWYWGVQVELSHFHTSLIPTSGATATRNSDNITATSPPWLNAAEGTIVYQGGPYLTPTMSATQYNRAFSICNNNSTNFMTCWAMPGTGSGNGISNWTGTAASVLQWNTPRYTVTWNQQYKVAATYKQNDIAHQFSTDASILTASSGNIPAAIYFHLGRDETGTSWYLSGHIRKLEYYPRRLTNQKLKALAI